MPERIITTKERDLWVYNLTLPKDEAFDAIAEPIQKYNENDDLIDWPMGVALGLPYLDHDFVEPLWIADLQTPLSDQILGMTRGDPSVIEPDKAALDAANGLVIFISCEPNDTAPSRMPDAPYQFLGVYRQEPYSFSLGQAEPTAAPEPPTAAQTSRRRTVLAAVAVGVACIIMAILQGFK